MRISTIGLTTLAFLLSPALQALDIVFRDIDTTPISAQQMDAFEEAAEIWESYFRDHPVTLNINIKLESLSNNNLAETLVTKTTHFWPIVATQMVADADSVEERGALAQLNASTIPIIDHSGGRNSLFVTLTTANAKALDLTTGRDPNYYPFPAYGADGTITLNSNYALDFNRSDGIPSGQYDVVSIVLHELGHIMGYVSQVENQDNNSFLVLPPMMQDVWRFTVSSSSHHLFSERRIITHGFAEYDDSVDTIEMSQGMGMNDPECPTVNQLCESSHFRGDSWHLMNPAMESGTIYNPTSIDLHVLDYIGWESTSTSPFFPILGAGWHEESVIVFNPKNWRLPPIPGGGYPAPLPISPSNVEFTPNLATVVPIELIKSDGQEALGGKRTLFGYLQLKPQQRIVITPIQGVSNSETWEVLHPSTQAKSVAVHVPPSICQAAMSSDPSTIPFTATLIGAPTCAPFDQNIGHYGGWRLPMCIRVGQYSTNEDKQCDARIILELALEKRYTQGSISARTLKRSTLTLVESSGGLRVFDDNALGF